MTAPRVLVADDSAVVRALLRGQLGARGYEVLEASDGEEAFELARRNPPDLVLLDLEMPRLDGFGVLELLKDDPDLALVPVVFVTSREDISDAVDALERGAHDYLRKPFQPVELQARVQAALRVKFLQDELRAVNGTLERQACTDQLTGLYNRRYLDGQLARLVSRAARHGRALAMVLIDIDRFKFVNDTLGHHAGDSVLVNLGARLARRLRAEDVFGRWGGEEFMVLAPEIDAAGAQALADALVAAIADAPVVTEDRPVPMTASAGWATWRGDTAEEIVRRADRALYAAKDAGRNRAVGEEAA